MDTQPEVDVASKRVAVHDARATDWSLDISRFIWHIYALSLLTYVVYGTRDHASAQRGEDYGPSRQENLVMPFH